MLENTKIFNWLLVGWNIYWESIGLETNTEGQGLHNWKNVTSPPTTGENKWVECQNDVATVK